MSRKTRVTLIVVLLVVVSVLLAFWVASKVAPQETPAPTAPSVMSSATTKTSSPTKRQTTTRTTPTKTTPSTSTSASTGMTVEVGALRMQVPLDWSEAGGGEGYSDLVDNTTCKASNAECPHIMVIDLNSPEFSGITDPLTNFAPKTGATTNQPAYEMPKLREVVSIGGINSPRYQQDICPKDVSRQTGFYWHLKERGMFVYNINPGKEPAHGLSEALGTITWKK